MHVKTKSRLPNNPTVHSLVLPVGTAQIKTKQVLFVCAPCSQRTSTCTEKVGDKEADTQVLQLGTNMTRQTHCCLAFLKQAAVQQSPP